MRGAERADAAMVLHDKDDDLLKVLPMETRQHAIAYQYMYTMQGPTQGG